MNIFALSSNPIEAAHQMCDKHIVKMPTETCQMLHTNYLYWLYVEENNKEPSLANLKTFHASHKGKLMKPAMLNHPSTQWARESFANFCWLFDHGIALCEEYTHRYGKRHGSHDRILEMGILVDKVRGQDELTTLTIAMDDKYRLDGVEYYKQNPNASDWDFVIDSYRNYYLEGKWEFARWTNRKSPDWWPDNHYVIKKNEQIRAFNERYGAKLNLIEGMI